MNTPTFTRRVVQIVPVVFQCPAQCSRYHTVAVRFDDDDAPLVTKLPDNCSCGAMLDTPAILRDLIGTARNLIEAAHHRRLS